MVAAASSNFAQFDAPDLPPILICERSDDGWRGLTEDGEVYQVHGNGIPSRLCIRAPDGRPLGYRDVPEATNGGRIDRYSEHFDRAVALTRANDLTPALPEMERALEVAPTIRARFGRAMILLGLGQWREGFAEYEQCERVEPFMRPVYREAIAAGLKPWQGESLAGKSLLLVHDHGFGDTIMCLRFVPMLKAMGAEVTIMAPPELKRLAEQCAPVTAELIEVDYFCAILHLLHWLKIEPHMIPIEPYLTVDPELIARWRERLGPQRKTVGVAWSVGKLHKGDYPREIPLADLCRRFDADAEIISVQQQGRDEAAGLGVWSTPFEDFADCAALMMCLDEIVAVDTAALHLAGAIGHKRVTGLLSHWASWRWLAVWYRNVNLFRREC